MKKILCAFVMMASAGAHAWDMQPIGKVKRIEVNSPTSSARNVIVSLVGVSQLCSLTSNNDTAYVNKADTPATYEIMVSTFLAAKTSGAEIQIYTELGPEGCRIGRVDLR
jgi:hypothetical protein